MKNLNHSELRSFFYGTLLGDSYIHNGTFYCKQITKDLIYFKADVIKKHLPDAKIIIRYNEAMVDKKGVSRQEYWTLSASGSEYIKKLNQLFYPEGKKIYPIGAVEKLDPLGFAMWYADDGTTILVGKSDANGSAKNRRVQLCTDSFSKEENFIIMEELLTHGFPSSLVSRCKNNQYRVQLATKEAQKFLIQIGQYFYNFPELLYKMDMGYRDDSLNRQRYVYPEYKEFFLKIKTHPQFIDRMIGR